MRSFSPSFVAAVCCTCCAAPLATALASPFATLWKDYNPGSNPSFGYTDPNAALGSPARFTGTNAAFNYPSAVTPFNGAFDYDQVVSIGTGGSLTLGFDQPITNNPLNPFGIDLIVFGNTSFIDADFPNGIVGGLFSEGGVVELSADGDAWITATGIVADGMIPTNGWTDLTDPFSTEPGTIPSNFNLPVDPSIDFSGMNFAQLLAAYNGSGGGTGIDIGAYGLSEVSFIRITNPGASNIEIDAISRVIIPAPGTLALVALAPAFVPSIARRRRG